MFSGGLSVPSTNLKGVMDVLRKMEQARDLLEEAISDLSRSPDVGRLKAETVTTLIALSRALDKAQARLESQLSPA